MSSTPCVWIDQWAATPDHWNPPPVEHGLRWPDDEYRQYHIYAKDDGNTFHFDPFCPLLMDNAGASDGSADFPIGLNWGLYIKQRKPCLGCAVEFVRPAIHGR